MQKLLCVAALCVLCHSSAQQWPVAYDVNESLPVLDISLGPPVHQLPESVASADVAFKAALEQMQSKIADVIGDVLARFDGSTLMQRHPSSFLAAKETPGSFSVTVHVAKPEATQRTGKKTIEQTRHGAEAAVPDKLLPQFTSLTDMVCTALRVELTAQVESLSRPHHVSFLETSPLEANVHVTSSGVADAMARQMVEDSELSRGLAEELAEEHLLELEVKLLQAANDMMKSQLSLVLQKIVGT